MKSKTCLSVILIILFSLNIKAQDSLQFISKKPPIPIEFMVGNNRLFYQLITNKKIVEKSKIGLFSVNSFIAENNNEINKNEYLSTNVVYYEIMKQIGINTGATFSSKEGLKPFIGLQYIYSNKNFMIIYLPSFYFTNSNKIDQLLLVEYKPNLNKKWSIYSRLQMKFAYQTENNHHFRSYLFTRLGLSYSNITFGIGNNTDWYGEAKIWKENDGFFIKINL